MSDKVFFALSQYRERSSYGDVIGEIYEFPNKYNFLQKYPGSRFVYYEPKKRGQGVYFGCGQIEEVVEKTDLEEDAPTTERRFIARIRDFYEFADPVPYEDADGKPREPILRNSVREIPKHLYEDILRLGGRRVSFTADAHLIQILGEQLIASEKVGILELIKNSFDAGASTCTVTIEKVPGLPKLKPDSDAWVSEHVGPVITIADNGDGMDESVIVNGWLRPATTLKTRIKDRLREEREKARARGADAEYESLVTALKAEMGGRLPIGEKGVGRFATQRLGKELLLITKLKHENFERVLQIDWDEFLSREGVLQDLSGVGFSLRRREPTWDFGQTQSGLVLRISGGKSGFEWDIETLRGLGHAIALLQSPDRKEQGFLARFYCQHLDDTEFAPPTETSSAPFICEAAVSEDGTADLTLAFHPPPSLAEPIPPQTVELSFDLRTKSARPGRWAIPGSIQFRTPRCGSFFVTIKCWLRRKEWIHGVDWKELTTYLDTYGGIAIYRDGLNIVSAELGSAKDWLSLSTAHIKKGSRLSYYNLWGRVELMQERSLDLIANTSREGLLDTIPFRDLSELVTGIVDELQLFVQDVRDSYERAKRPLIDAEAAAKRAASVMAIVQQFVSRYDFVADPLELSQVLDDPKESPKIILTELNDLLDQLRESIEQLEAQIDGLVEAAGFGLSIGTAVHEIEKVAGSLLGRIRALSKSLSVSSRHRQQVDLLERTAATLSSELSHIAPLRLTRLEHSTTFSVRQAVLAAMGGFHSAWKAAGVDVPLPPTESDFVVKQRFGACTQIIANLLDNATHWVKGSSSKRKGERIVVQIRPKERTIVVADSGPGISTRIRKHLFEPFYSLKSPPSGLGLFISKRYMNAMVGDQSQAGEIYEATPEERISDLSGAQFVLQFPPQKEVS